MKCSHAKKLLDDYHYGELEAEQAAEVAGHLRDCDGCRTELARLESETRIYEAYNAKTDAFDLPADLWKRALERPSSQSGRGFGMESPEGLSWILRWFVPAAPWARQAAAALLLVTLSVAGTLLVVEHYHAKEKAASVAVSTDKSLDAALESIQRAEQQYIQAIEELNAIVEKQKPTLDPRMVAELQANLKLIDSNIAATRKAYYAHPKDTELALYMLAAYNRKVELLQDLTS